MAQDMLALRASYRPGWQPIWRDDQDKQVIQFENILQWNPTFGWRTLRSFFDTAMARVTLQVFIWHPIAPAVTSRCNPVLAKREETVHLLDGSFAQPTRLTIMVDPAWTFSEFLCDLCNQSQRTLSFMDRLYALWMEGLDRAVGREHLRAAKGHAVTLGFRIAHPV
jgi:hypothetical protein